MASMSDVNELLKRIQKLESTNKKIRFVAGASILVALVALGFGLRNRSKIEVNEVLIRDQSGDIVARLGGGKRGVCLSLIASTKLARADLCTSNSGGATLYLRDEQHKATAELSAGQSEHPAWRLPGLHIENSEQNWADLSVGDETELRIGRGPGESSASITSAKDGAGVRLFGGDGKVVWAAPPSH
jgi:hypothetical protein